MTGWKAIEQLNLCQICWFCPFQVVLQIKSDEHIFKFLKSKFGYGVGRYVSYNKMKCHPLFFLFVNATSYEPWVKTWSLSNHDDVDDNSFYEQNNGPASISLALFSTFLWLLDYDVKSPNAAFYGGREHMTASFPFSFWTWIKSFRMQLLEKSPTLDELSESR